MTPSSEDLVLDDLIKHYGDVEMLDVVMFHIKHSLTYRLEPTQLSTAVMHQRILFLQEELNELAQANREGSFIDMIDALVDLVVVAKGTAVMMGLEWHRHWNEVQRANMSKVRGHNAHRPNQEEDLVKPEGWIPPNHHQFLLPPGE